MESLASHLMTHLEDIKSLVHNLHIILHVVLPQKL